MKLPRPLVVNTTLAAVIIAAGAGVYFVANPIAAASIETTQLTGTVQQGVVSSTITASGSIAAVRQVSASFSVSGTIATVDVALGSTVTAGQQLGTLVT
jgi:macrolide-specific efflux system membrane fusion protein